MKLLTNLVLAGFFAISCAHVQHTLTCDMSAIEQSAKDLVLSALEADNWQAALAQAVTTLGADTVNCIVAEIVTKKSAKENPDPSDTTVVVRGKMYLAKQKMSAGN